MSLSSMNLIGQTGFKLESKNENVGRQTDGQTKGQKTDKLTNIITPIKPSYDGDLCPSQV